MIRVQRQRVVADAMSAEEYIIHSFNQRRWRDLLSSKTPNLVEIEREKGGIEMKKLCVRVVCSVAEVQFSPVQSTFRPNLNSNLLKKFELEPELELNLLNRFRRFGPSSVQVRTHELYKKN